ncbi:MAG: GNAT family N-acetyltransferase [Deltaproteobacteria bacterium]|nr:MAG: GNAT family N-acetyltransferase [Deltaproteobacteria bacterium]
MKAERASQTLEHAIEELLDRDPIQNLFLLGVLASQPIESTYWYLVMDQEVAIGVALIFPRTLAVPFTLSDEAALALGDLLREQHRPCMMVGPRSACDLVWRNWAPDLEPLRRIDQRLYVCREIRGEAHPEAIRRARPEEWPTLAEYARSMELEDLGRDPCSVDPELHARVVKERIGAGKTWVLDHAGEIGFTVNVGTQTATGCQVGGTYVPPHLRGRGLATLGMRALTRRLLREHSLVTLHVNEQNRPAVRCYERAGYLRGAAFRILTTAHDVLPD